MKLRTPSTFSALLLVSVIAGHFFSHSRSKTTPSAQVREQTEPQTPSPEKSAQETASRYKYEFDSPFDPRAELDRAIKSEDQNERLGRFMAIGYNAAQQNQRENFEKLSPEIWDYRNYDLRGAFQAEWLRTDPVSYLDWAEPTYERLKKENKLRLFPSYHLAYLEPFSTLQCLPLVKNDSLKRSLKSNLLSTLVELDPETLWSRRDEIASILSIIEEAEYKGLYSLVLDFWGRSNWIEMSFDPEFIEYLAKEKRTDLFQHLEADDQTSFIAYYALEEPEAAATWPTIHTISPNIYASDFTLEHAAFFRYLIKHPDFESWQTGPKWIYLFISLDKNNTLTSTIFEAIRSHPKLSYVNQIQYTFGSYILKQNDSAPLKAFYLSLDNDHPILSTIEAYMMDSAQDFSSALIARATQELPTPERLLNVLAYGDVSSWPDSYFAAARDTLNSISDEDLMWSLSPYMVLSALDLDPDRIQTLLANSDPTWLNNTLSSPGFTEGVTMENYSKLPEILQDLPDEKRANIIENARIELLRSAYGSEDKTPYLRMAQTAKEAAMVSAQISFEEYQDNDSLKREIQAHPQKESMLLGIVSESYGEDFEDPELKRAAKLLQKGEELLHQNRGEIVSTIQSLPTEDRFSIVKTALLVNTDHHLFPATRKIIDLPIWSDAQKRELQDVNYHNEINFNLLPPLEPIDVW